MPNDDEDRFDEEELNQEDGDDYMGCGNSYCDLCGDADDYEDLNDRDEDD